MGHEREGFDLFLRFADGCRCYLLDRGMVSRDESREVSSYLEGDGARPKEALLRRMYYAAFPGLEQTRKRLGGRSIMEPGVVREFYAVEHNQRKSEEGNIICLAYPARVMETNPHKPGRAPLSPFGRTVNDVTIELAPLKGRFTLGTDLELREGDWVMTHRMAIVERLDEAFAARMAGLLEGMGLSGRDFPRKAFRYLTGLREAACHA